MPDWRLQIDQRFSGAANMAADLANFQDLEKSDGLPILRIYSWSAPCISLGYSQKIEKEIDLAKAKALGWEVVVRPTGGGIVFHNEAEVTYSLNIALDNPLLPPGLIPAYKKISAALIKALAYLGVDAEVAQVAARNESSLCFSFPAKYEVVARGRKIIGSAQKRGRRALLQQGSIFVRPTSQADLAILKRPAAITAISLEEILQKELPFASLSAALIHGFGQELGVNFQPAA